MNIGEVEPRLKGFHQSLEHLVRQMGPLGRDGDKERLVESLLSGDGNDKNVGVVLIVGMSGLGKTTLAQLVYKDNRVQQFFDFRIWVYVPKELEAFHVTRDIMKEVGLGDGIDNMTANQMHCELEKKLSGNRVLLVLDDVWCSTQGEWDSLMKPFMSVKHGSKILVTTRHSSVAGVMSSATNHLLAELSEENCWLLFAKHAFDGKSCHEYSALETVGREMVKKCNGLPLAAKAVGGFLRSERRVGRWRNILNSSTWDLPNNEILPALRLSYSHLPPSLKQCFAYCAILPKNRMFTKENLVLSWITEDFIPSSRREESMEVGERYFEDLVSRSFFQKQTTTNVYGETIFALHDLMNDLAALVSREFCSRLEGLNLLPESICCLYNMQILILKGCSNLTSLPNGMSKSTCSGLTLEALD